jgi:O-antigen ligase
LSKLRPSDSAPPPGPIREPAFRANVSFAAPPQPNIAARVLPLPQPGKSSPREDSSNPFRSLALLIGLAFVFVKVSYLHEVITLLFGIPSYLPTLLGVPALAGAILCGGVGRVLRVRATLFWIAFALWLLVALSFSTWRGGSFEVLRGYFQTMFPLFLIIGGTVASLRDLRWTMMIIGLSGIVVDFSGTYLVREGNGDRLASMGSIGNANDFATHLLFVLPIMWFVFGCKQIPAVIRYLMLPATIYSLFLVVRTSSRGAFVGLLAAFLIIVIQTRGTKRFAFALLVPVVLIGVLTLMPHQVTNRLSTILGENTGDEGTSASSVARKFLFWRSLEITANNPVFGVGPGNFFQVSGGAYKAKGEVAAWMEAHNSYTQISSEAGIPALFFFLTTLVLLFMELGRLMKLARERGHQMLENATLAVRTTFIIFCIPAFFLSLAYRLYFPALVGLAIAVIQVARHELAVGQSAMQERPGGSALAEY